MATREYKGSDSQMLLACSYIVDRGLENVETLSARRPQWTEHYFSGLKLKIVKAFDENIGVDILPQIKEATAIVNSTISKAHRGIMELKQEIEVDFRKNPVRRDSLLTALGLSKLSLKNGTQAGYIDILFTLKSNLTAQVKTELIAAGANPEFIDSLLAQATLLIEANDVQKALKVSRKSGNAVNVETLNDIYDEIISICKLVNAYFVGNKEMQQQFSFINALKEHGFNTRSKKDNGTDDDAKS